MRIIRYFFYCVFCFFASSNTLKAQSIIPRFETLNVDDGLSQSSVYAILQDKFGFIWIGTADGLNRFDGEQMKIFKIRNEKLDIESNQIRGNLSEDVIGNIWFANESGIYCFVQTSQKIISVLSFSKKEFGGASFYGLYIRANKFWMLNASYGIFVLDISTNKLSRYDHELFSSKIAMSPFYKNYSSDGKIWFAFSDDRGLWSFDTKSGKYQPYNNQNCFDQIHFAKGKHYLVKDSMVFCYDSLSKLTTRFLGSRKGIVPHKCLLIFPDAFNRIWMASSAEGLAFFDQKFGYSQNFKHDNAKAKSFPLI